MDWQNGSTSYIMLENCNTGFLPNFGIIGIFLLISYYCFVLYGRKAYIHDESEASGRRFGSPNNYGIDLRHIRTGYRPGVMISQRTSE